MRVPAVPGDLSFRALSHHIHEFLKFRLPDHEWVRLTGFARLQIRHLLECPIHDGMVFEFDVNLHLLRYIFEMPYRVEVLLKLAGGKSVCGAQDRSTEESSYVPLAVVRNGEDKGQGSRRVPWN